MSEVNNYKSFSAEDVADFLLEKKSTLIIFHVHPDGDATGSAFALRTFLEENGCPAWCICADSLSERLSFLSVGQDSVSRDDIPADFVTERVVTVDTASPGQMGALYEIYKDKVDLMIDHHGKGTPYADNCIIPEAAACGEVLYDILKIAAEKTGRGLSGKICELLYAAVSADTGCFRYSNTTSHTHTVAAELIGAGVKFADINHRLLGIKTLKQMQVEHAGFERMNFYCDGRMAVITFPYDLKAQYGADDDTMETLVDVVRCVKGVEVAAVIKQPTSENKFRVSMRSSSDFDVSEVCAHYGGGGHMKAAGCTITADSILSAEMTIVVAVEHRMCN